MSNIKMENIDMTVMKRDGIYETMSFDKILIRVKKLSSMEPPLNINHSKLVIKIVDQLYDKIPTTKIDELTAQECASQTTINPDLGVLASRIVISNNHKNTDSNLLTITNQLYEHQLINPTYYQYVSTYYAEYMSMIDFNRDYDIDYFGFKTLEKSYLMHIHRKTIERPQHLWLRVAICIHGDQLPLVKQTYDLLSQKYFTHATPTLFNAGTNHQQLSSCFLVAMKDDSIDGIYDTLKECALISKHAGGIGLHIHNIRATGTHIKGTNGTSNGIIPMLRNFNETARYVDQGGGKRNGSFSIYLSPDHADIEEWLDLKKNTGDENARARDLFYGLWIPDLFMHRVKHNMNWSLFCPHKCPGLNDAVGDDYTKLYEQYEKEGKQNKVMSARTLWFKILDAQMETGNPSLLYKDACNLKSNQQNLGTIKSSNLCTEIVEYSDANETAVCNLASIGLSKYVKNKVFDYAKLHEVVKVITHNLNKIIDINYYPTPCTYRSNVRHRPLGIGVQGLADAFILMDLPFHSEQAKEVNKQIFETIYHAAMEKSVELAMEYEKQLEPLTMLNCIPEFYDKDYQLDMKELNELYHQLKPLKAEIMRNQCTGSYSSFDGSPLSKGIFQFDLWKVTPSMYDWTELREKVMKYGARNSLLLAPMPTASTSQILGNNECFEPITSNIYTRRTLAGEFIIINEYLVRELMELKLWDESTKNKIIKNGGSVQSLDIPLHLKEKYKIVWEIPMKHIIEMSRDRGAFICQSQSLNLWIDDPNYKVLTSMHFYAWEQGLKTGIYYLRRKPRHQPQQFTIEPEKCETCSA
jgi:ribonucleoside-diphosphate reductase alpha chain